MRYFRIIILLVLCLTLLLLTGCMINTGKSEPASGNLENQEDIDQSSSNSQSSSIGLVEEPVIEEGTEATGTVYPQKWATGTGTASNPWANDCIKKAYDAFPTGGTIYLRAGYYQLAGQLDINKQVNIIGEGMNKTTIITANARGFQINADYCVVKNLTVDGDAQTDADGGMVCINSSQADYLLYENIEIKNAGYYGINMNDPNHCTLRNIHAHDNYRHGVHSGANKVNTDQYNTFEDIYCWNHANGGFDARGGYDSGNNIYDNIQSSGDVQFGIGIGNQKNSVISNSIATGNGTFGMYLYGLENVNFTNVIVKNNANGIYIWGCNNITFTACQSNDDRNPSLQQYGIELTGTNTGLTLVNCKLSPNKIGEIYNPNGAEIIINNN